MGDVLSSDVTSQEALVMLLRKLIWRLHDNEALQNGDVEAFLDLLDRVAKR